MKTLNSVLIVSVIVAPALVFAQRPASHPRKESPDGRDRSAFHERIEQAREKREGTAHGERQQRPGGGGPDAGALSERLISNPRVQERLGLSEEQRAKLRTEGEKLRAEQQRLNKALEDAALKQARILTGEAFSESELMQAVEETGRIRTELAKNRMQHMLLMRNVLTPDQTENMRKMIQERRREGERGRDQDRDNQHNRDQQRGRQRMDEKMQRRSD